MEHDENTPAPDIAPSDRPSPDAYSIARLVGCLHQVAVDLGQVAARLDSLSGDDRRLLATQLEPQLREIGDLGHEAARAVRDVLMGGGG